MNQKLKTLFLLSCFLLAQLNVYAQVEYVPNQLLVKVADEAAIPTVTEDALGNKHYQFDSPILNALFTQFNLESYEPAYTGLERIRHRHVAELKKVYALSCDCDAADLHFVLERDAGSLFETVEQVPILEVTSTDCCLGCTATCNNPWIPNDYAFQDYDQTELTCAWEITQGDPNIIIDINDVNFEDHQDFLGTVSNGKPKITFAQTVQPCGPPTGQNPSNARHATKMASIATAQANNGLGMAGVANNCRLMYHVWGIGNFTDAADRGAHVINCSWVGGCPSNPSNHTTIDMVTDLGVVVVASAGNNNCSGNGGNVGLDPNENMHGYTYPSSYDNVISVTSISPRDEYALEIGTDAFTSGTCHADKTCEYVSHTKNLEVDISAPGYCVAALQGCIDDHVGTGTSQASAFVSGVVGLMLSANPCLQPADVESILKSTADDVSCIDHAPPFCQTQTVHDNADYVGTAGAGRVNTYQAVLAAKNFQPSFNTFIITNNETWTDVVTAQEIVIQSGVRLTIRGTTLRMAEGAKIIVENGAALEVDDSKITNACANGMWGGIQVWGDASEAHPDGTFDPFTNNSADHGLVLVHNNSILENVRHAISTYKEGGGSEFYGGIVIAHDSEFLNNRRDIQFLAFPSENRSEIINCDFLKERPTNYDDQYVQSVSMWGVEGVDFQANDFFVDTNEMPIGTGIGNGYTCFGINTARASFVVDANCTFEGFYRAVELTTSIGGMSVVEISNSVFNNNRDAFFSSGGHNSTLTSNVFDNNSLYSMHFGVDDLFFVADNTIDNFNYAISSYETDNMPNEIRNNTFDTGTTGIISRGVNDQLLFLCNDFIDTDYNVYLTNGLGAGGSVREWQGFFDPNPFNQDSEDAAANLFSTACPNNHTHIYTQWQQNMQEDHFHYVHHNTNLPNINPRYEPTCFQNVIQGLSGYANFTTHLIDAPDPGTCVATGHGKSGTASYAELNLKTLSKDLKAAQIAIEALKQQIDGGNTDLLIYQVQTTSLSVGTLETLLSASPYLSEEVLLAVVEHLPNPSALKVLAANAPFSKNIWRAISEYTPNYEEADLNYLAGIGNGALSPMQSLSFELSERSFQRLSLLYEGIYELVALKDFASAEQILLAEENYSAKKLLAKVYLQANQYGAAQKLCNNLPERNLEESDYKKLLQLAIDVEKEGKTYFDITKAQEQEVRRIAKSTTRTAAYAQAILRLVFNEDFEFPAIDPIPKPTKQMGNPSMDKTVINAFKAVPNPTHQITELQIPLNYVDGQTSPTIVVRDITGKEVLRQPLEKGQTSVVLTTTKWTQGLYLCHLLIDGKVFEQTKLIVTK